jgi:iron complex transport system substrate-binding protein
MMEKKTAALKDNWIVVPFALLFAAIAALGIAPPAVSSQGTVSGPVKDMTGRRISLRPPAERVIGIAPIVADYLTIDQTSSHVVALSRPSLNGMKDGFLKRFFPATLNLPVTSPTVTPTDPEILLALHPDAVFTWSHASDSLKAIQLPSLVQVRLTIGNFPAEIDRWRLLGAVAGKQQRAETLLQGWLRRREILRQNLQTRRAVPVRVVILNRVLDSWVLGSGRNFYLNDDLEFAGAKNAASNIVFSNIPGSAPEQLMMLKPDIILLNASSDMSSPEDLYQRPEYGAIKAVQEHRVYLMPAYYLSGSAVVENPLVLQWMAEIFHPDLVPPALRHEYQAVYDEVYGYHITDDEIDDAICYRENEDSLGYERFSRANRL